MTPEELAEWVQGHPKAPETLALRAWAEDTEMFAELKWKDTPRVFS